jgi:HAD superfamily hydrolase (TIGR01484 family)
MRYVALALDYDGTLAHDSRVPENTIQSLQKFRQSGRKLILVTGRILEDLSAVFERLDLFDRVVTENGAVLHNPGTHETEVLAPAPKQAFVDALRQREILPLSVGNAIVATWHPNETAVLEIIRDLGLDLQVIFNKGAVMVLPSGINKKSGLAAALDSLGLSAHNVVGAGDAENDHAFLECCECAVAVANAHPAIKDTADFVTARDHGAGVSELIDLILKDDLASHAPARREIPIGREGEAEMTVPAYGSSLLVAGASGSGKSTFVAGLLEMLIERRYQVCLIDPEGDYEAFPETISVGDEKHPPAVEEALQILRKPASQVIVNLMGIAVPDRPKFLPTLLPRLQEMRLAVGRPHWIIVDEAHHMLPPEWAPPSAGLAGELNNLLLITVHPAALKAVDAVFAVGPAPTKVMEAFAAANGTANAPAYSGDLGPGQVLAWFPKTGDSHVLHFRFARAERKRHKRNYAYGELSEDRSFYFRGPEQKLNLRAQNLATFVQLAEGLDDETWLYHLNQGDYSRWFRNVIKDEALADEVAQAEKSEDPRESRERVKLAIEHRYTAPA